MAQVRPITRHTTSTADKNYEVNYFKCKNGIFDLDLNIYEQMTLIYLTSLQNALTIYVSHATIAKKCKVSVDTVIRALKSLETKGYVLVKHQAAIGKTNNYRISRKCKEKIRQAEAKTLPLTATPPIAHSDTTPTAHSGTIITSIYNYKRKDGDMEKRPNDKIKSKEDLNERRRVLDEQAKLLLRQEQTAKDKDSGLKQKD